MIDYYSSARMAYDKGDYPSAKQLFLEDIKHESAFTMSYFFLAKISFLQENFEEALSFLQRFYVEYLPLIAPSAVELQHLEERDRSLQKIYRDTLAEAYDLQGQCHQKLGLVDEARESFATAFEYNPFAVSANHNLGLFKIELAKSILEQDVNEAYEVIMSAQLHLTFAVNMGPTNPMVLNALGSLKELMVSLAEKCSNYNPSESDLFEFIESYELALDYYQQALTACREDDSAMQTIVKQNQTECLAQLGHAYYRTDQYLKARECYQQVVASDPTHTVTYHQMAMAYVKDKHYAKAHFWFTQETTHAQDAQTALDGILGNVYCFRLEQKFIDAKAYLDKASELKPVDDEILEEAAALDEAMLAKPQFLGRFGVKAKNLSASRVANAIWLGGDKKNALHHYGLWAKRQERVVPEVQEVEAAYTSTYTF